MRALVVNCSAPSYNLGAQKLVDWLRKDGHSVTAADPQAVDGLFAFGYDLVCLSVIFSWHAPVARAIALRVRSHSEVWCGGPGMTALIGWWRDQTGLEAVKGLDSRFDLQRGAYRATFASRGCPVGCSFCIVPHVEGSTFTLDWDFVPAPELYDNNLSALPVDFQQHIIRRYHQAGARLRAAKSGFEPRTFSEDTFARWKPLMRTAEAWRLAFDEQREAGDVCRMMRILQPIRPRRTQVYVLIGNEPIASCLERALNVIDWGGEPYCQPVMRLNVLSRSDLWVRHDWTVQMLRDFARYFNRRLWRSLPIAEYRPRRGEPEPFRRLGSTAAAHTVAAEAA